MINTTVKLLILSILCPKFDVKKIRDIL